VIGKTLWKYKITEFLGSGGSAKVWKAYDERTKREVAIKVLPEDFDAMLLARFKQETKTISQLDHPNIIKIHDIGTDGKINYYVMDYVKGKTLKEHIHERYELEKGSISSQEVTKVSRELAGALDYIHQRRVYHRDIKPGNILITEDGRSILMDFGIAKAKDDKTLTAAGTLMGTPLYMSPEQLQAQEVDHRSDIYQLGIVMYKMATGKVPFEGENSYSAAARRLTEKIPLPSRYNPTISPALERIILKCTLKDKSQRYQTSAQLGEDLQAVLENRDVTVEVKGRGDATIMPAAAPAEVPKPAEAAARAVPALPLKLSLVVNALLLIGLLGMFVGGSKKPVSLSPRKVEANVGTATIAFKTGQPVRTELTWGRGEDLTRVAVVSAEPETEHRVTLEGLDPGEDYAFSVRLIVDGKQLAQVKPEKFKTRSREEIEAVRGRKTLVDEEVALLLDALKAGDYKVRLQAAQALGEAGPDTAIDPLVKLLRDKNNEVREASHAAIGRIVKRVTTP
jgi:tRNA A-37 threonylcarbamoyl transferase component Bud32